MARADYSFPPQLSCSRAASRLETAAGTTHIVNCAVNRVRDFWRTHNTMDNIIIKEEVEDTFDAEYHLNSSSPDYSTSSAYSASLSTTVSTISVPPTQRVTPSTLSARRGMITVGSGRFTHFNQNAGDIFYTEPRKSCTPPGLKRKGEEVDPSRSKHVRAKPSLISPPLLSTRPAYHPQNRNPRTEASKAQDGISQDDEWKNIKVMLNCICGMVEKTQSAISILQQRQAEVANVRNAEELVAAVEAKANMAIFEVKQAALEEIKKAKGDHMPDIQNDCKEQSCWNCGRPATETCSGCGLVRYCGPFCQHKDWEDHARVCRADQAIKDISDKQREGDKSPRAKERTANKE